MYYLFYVLERPECECGRRCRRSKNRKSATGTILYHRRFLRFVQCAGLESLVITKAHVSKKKTYCRHGGGQKTHTSLMFMFTRMVRSKGSTQACSLLW